MHPKIQHHWLTYSVKLILNEYSIGQIIPQDIWHENWFDQQNKQLGILNVISIIQGDW